MNKKGKCVPSGYVVSWISQDYFKRGYPSWASNFDESHQAPCDPSRWIHSSLEVLPLAATFENKTFSQYQVVIEFGQVLVEEEQKQ